MLTEYTNSDCTLQTFKKLHQRRIATVILKRLLKHSSLFQLHICVSPAYTSTKTTYGNIFKVEAVRKFSRFLLTQTLRRFAEM